MLVSKKALFNTHEYISVKFRIPIYFKWSRQLYFICLFLLQHHYRHSHVHLHIAVSSVKRSLALCSSVGPVYV